MIIRVLNCPEDKCTNKCCDYNLGFFLQTMQELQELLKDKFDIASQKLLLNASTYADSETMKLKYNPAESDGRWCDNPLYVGKSE